MYVIVAEIEALPGMEGDYLALLRGTVAELAADPCLERFDISVSPTDPRRFLLHEIWQSRERYLQLRKGPVFARYLSVRESCAKVLRSTEWERVG